jgi:hypothetical protein
MGQDYVKSSDTRSKARELEDVTTSASEEVEIRNELDFEQSVLKNDDELFGNSAATALL